MMSPPTRAGRLGYCFKELPVMDLVATYLPPDRYRALLNGTDLPLAEDGAVLFADIAGFTALTEALMLARGQRQGAEDLADQLNSVYTAVIGEVERAGGSVISFSGDAITVWFAGDACQRAIISALAIHTAMERFTSLPLANGAFMALAVKVAIVCGPVRRFLVGNETYGLIDVLAGTTIDRLADLEQSAQPGEVVLDGQSARRWADWLDIAAWRTYGPAAEPAAVVRGCGPLPAPAAVAAGSPGQDQAALAEDHLRPWLAPAVWARFQAGQGEFLTELRPAVALFLRFTGLAYETAADAEPKLNRFVGWVQQVADQFGGTLLQLTIGDKGSYAYLCFGAPIAHDDDPIRAIRAAEQLRTPPAECDFIQTIQIGLGSGIMRTGAYGGSQRRTYGVLGDGVNVAARLMLLAQPGQILADQSLAERVGSLAEWEPLAPVALKGKATPLAVYRLRPESPAASRRLPRAHSAPLIGRGRELAALDAALAEALAGQGQIIGLVGEAGIGKSRLIEAWAAQAARGLTVYYGACSSYGLQTPYLVWQTIWQAFFGLDGELPPEQLGARLAAALAEFDPDFPLRLPLLNPVLNTAIADTDFTREFDAKLRKQSREALLVESLRIRARQLGADQGGIVMILEDAHGIDGLSHELLEAISRILDGLPVLIVLVARPPETPEQPWPDPARLERFRPLPLAEFSLDEAAALGAATLAALGYTDATLAADLITPLMERTRGNPFYLEEVLQYLHAQGADLRRAEAWPAERLPLSLQSVILSRVDHLPIDQQGLLKTASIIGLLFAADWLCGYYPSLGSVDSVNPELLALCERHLLRWMAAADPTYAFHHGLTQEVLYASLPGATRARLHERLGAYLESTLGTGDAQASLLAYHYGRSANLEKKRHYLRRAGDLAADAYANEAAIAAYEELLPLLDDPAERGEVLRSLGSVLVLVGRWDDAKARYEHALELAEAGADNAGIAQSQKARGQLLVKQGDMKEAVPLLEQAAERFLAGPDVLSYYQTLAIIGDCYYRQGIYDQARQLLEAALNNIQREHIPQAVMSLYINLGNVLHRQGDYEGARARAQQCLSIAQEIQHYQMQAVALNNLAILASDQGKYEFASAHYAQSLEISRRIGDKWGQGMVLVNALSAYEGEHVPPAAVACIEEALRIAQELGAKPMIVAALSNLGHCARKQGDFSQAHDLHMRALALAQDIGDQRSQVTELILLGDIAWEQQLDYLAITWTYKGIELAYSIGYRMIFPYMFLRVAAIIVPHGADSVRDSVRLLSWSAKDFAASKASSTYNQRIMDRAINDAKQALSEDEFGELWAAGSALTVDEAIAISRAWAEKFA
jgi:class 3 adenylate cyclase/tetratricopeptide (TPR) repeat protein